jgi:hypothetical protein
LIIGKLWEFSQARLGDTKKPVWERRSPTRVQRRGEATSWRGKMGKGILLWLIGVPIPVIILLFMFHVIH